MRFAAISLISLTSLISSISSNAAADPAPAFELHEDGALGVELTDQPLLARDKGLDAKVAACLVKGPAPAGSALYWLELGKAGAVTSARVHGTGSAALDGCIASGLKKAVARTKLPSAVIVVGRIDVPDPASDPAAGHAKLLPSPKLSDVAVLIDPKGARWQLGTKRIAYTSNRAADIAAALDAQATALDACASKRAAALADTDLYAWTDGKAVVKGSGNAAYDTCLGKALDAIKLPAPTSAIWMVLSLRKPAEPLAARTDKASLSRERLLADALTTAVRSRKDALLGCTDERPGAKLTKVTVALAAGKARISAVKTGDVAADACIKTKLIDVPIKAAEPADKVELEVTLEPN